MVNCSSCNEKLDKSSLLSGLCPKCLMPLDPDIVVQLKKELGIVDPGTGSGAPEPPPPPTNNSNCDSCGAPVLKEDYDQGKNCPICNQPLNKKFQSSTQPEVIKKSDSGSLTKTIPCDTCEYPILEQSYLNGDICPQCGSKANINHQNPPSLQPKAGENDNNVPENSVKIRIINSVNAGKEIVVNQNEIIGREIINKLTNSKDSYKGISRHHFSFSYDGNLKITDQNSTNGTIVNGVKLNPNDFLPTKIGDRIELGDRDIVFYITGYSQSSEEFTEYFLKEMNSSVEYPLSQNLGVEEFIGRNFQKYGLHKIFEDWFYHNKNQGIDPDELTAKLKTIPRELFILKCISNNPSRWSLQNKSTHKDVVVKGNTLKNIDEQVELGVNDLIKVGDYFLFMIIKK